MSESPTIQRSLEIKQVLDPQFLHQHWQSVNQLAAASRLNLAQRYRTDYDRLDIEFANLRTSHAWLANQDDEVADEFLIGYVQAMASYLRQRGFYIELLRWCEDGLQAGARLRQNPGWLLLLRSEAQNLLGQWVDAEASIQAAIQVSREEDPHTHAQAILALGRLWFNQGNYDQALQTLTDAETLLSAQTDYDGLATIRAEFAAYYLNRGELDQALSLYMEVDKLHRRAGAIETADHTLLMLGVVYRKMGKYEQAANYLEQLLTRAQARRNQGATATAAHHLSWTHLNQGDLAQARRLCGQAITLYEEIGDLRGASDAYEQMGLIFWAEGETSEAIVWLEQSLTVRQRLGNQHGAASSLRHLAIVYLRTGKLIPATRLLWQSLTSYHRLGVLSRQRLMAMGREMLDWTVGRRRWTM